MIGGGGWRADDDDGGGVSLIICKQNFNKKIDL